MMISTVRQIAYLVPDLEAATRHWSSVFGIGPWFASDPMPARNAVYRGHAGQIALRAASSYSGDVEIELIEPIGNDPSIYREAIDRIGYGLHHLCHHSDDLGGDIASMVGNGHELVQEFNIGDFRIVYLGRPGVIGSYTELIHMTPEVAAMMAGWRQAAAEWDGQYRITYLNHADGVAR